MEVRRSNLPAAARREYFPKREIMRIRPLNVVLLLAGLLALSGEPLAAAQPLKTENVILVMNDGVRWEEVFRGAEDLLMSSRLVGLKRPS